MNFCGLYNEILRSYSNEYLRIFVVVYTNFLVTNFCGVAFEFCGKKDGTTVKKMAQG